MMTHIIIFSIYLGYVNIKLYSTRVFKTIKYNYRTYLAFFRAFYKYITRLYSYIHVEGKKYFLF